MRVYLLHILEVKKRASGMFIQQLKIVIRVLSSQLENVHNTPIIQHIPDRRQNNSFLWKDLSILILVFTLIILFVIKYLLPKISSEIFLSSLHHRPWPSQELDKKEEECESCQKTQAVELIASLFHLSLFSMHCGTTRVRLICSCRKICHWG